MNKLVCNLPEDDYFSIDAASQSTLNHMIKTPAHCFSYQEAPHEPTKDMIMGSAIHTYTLEGHTAFSERYGVLPEGTDRRTKIGKEIYSIIKDKGLTILNYQQFEIVRSIRQSIHQNSFASDLLFSREGLTEVSMFWQNDDVDYPCKGRIDRIADDHVLVDLKTTDDASPDCFLKSVVKYGYHRQAQFYKDGYYAVTGNVPDAFYFVVVEKKPPFCVATYELNDQMLAVGKSEYHELLFRYKECKETAKWPGYPDDPVMLELPGWYCSPT